MRARRPPARDGIQQRQDAEGRALLAYVEGLLSSYDEAAYTAAAVIAGVRRG